jgi:hypothetical protein
LGLLQSIREVCKRNMTRITGLINKEGWNE